LDSSCHSADASQISWGIHRRSFSWWKNIRGTVGDGSSVTTAAAALQPQHEFHGGGVFDGGAYIWDTVVGDCHKASAAVPRLPIHFRQKTNKPTEN